ncbi:hypothetical protein GM160_00715 [Guyparkeria halophila]|uniref:DNA-binding protein n=1 Tax=Guyparkeria halophila TaxID=47960 RepID=A0A6I6CU56_9GAMM|nr:hypothetical protein [Guyparkeria halophila]QGT77519.1 hypothetical protein GM160_00715 [Guyparkeria halophila]
MKIRYQTSSEEVARALNIKKESLHAHLSRNGHYFGLRPIKLPNRFLAWPDDFLERLLVGNTEGEKQNGEGGAA